MRRVILGCLCIAIVTTLGPSQALAQLELAVYRPGTTIDDGFFVNRPTDRGHLVLSGRLAADYALNPVRIQGSGYTPDNQVVADHLVAHAQVAFGLWNRVVLSAALPVHLIMRGDHYPGAPQSDGPGVGDLAFGVRLRLLGELDSDLALALSLQTTLPTARWAMSSQLFQGETDWTAHPELLMELRPGDAVRITIDSGIRLRSFGPREWQSVVIDHALTGALGIAVPILRRASISACHPAHDRSNELLGLDVETYGSTPLARLGDQESSPFEVLAGARISPQPELAFGIAMGVGISSGIGASEFRSILTFDLAQAMAPRTACHPREPDQREGAEQTGRSTPSMNDVGDVESPGTESPGPESPGTESVAQTSTHPQRDPQNRVPRRAEERHTEVHDTSVNCSSGAPSAECPTSIRMDGERGIIELRTGIEFGNQRANLLPSTIAVLEDIATVLRANPSITRLRVEGHTDGRGREQRNLRLSRRRALAVARWLVRHGIDPSRLEAWGCGERHPLDSNRLASGRALNRRIELHILEPAAPDPILHSGCLAARRVTRARP